jgi:lysophospholipase L1-like esterase
MKTNLSFTSARRHLRLLQSVVQLLARRSFPASTWGRSLFAALGLLGLANPDTASAAPTIYTVGDSTVQVYNAGYYPRAGWGSVLHFFVDPTKATVVDRAVGGTSSKSFYDSFWTPIKNGLKAGDYVTIQFGINDSAADVARHTVPFTTFKDYLTLFVNETKAKGAFPILVSTQNRNAWNATTPPTVYPAYHDYPVATRQLAGTLNVPLIDLDLMCTSLLQSVGPVYSTNFIYNHYQPGDWPNYPTGNSDDVHFQEMGAIEMAKLVVQGIRNLSGDTNVGKLIPFLTPTYKVTFNSSNAAAGLVTRTEFFPAGITVTAFVWPNAGFTFSNWSGGITGTKRNTTFVMGTAARTITANFTGGSSATTYPAENAVLTGTGTVTETSNAGFHGTAYVNFPATGGTATFNNVSGGAGGARTLVIRFANGTTAARTGQLVVNGTTTSITFNPTGAWTTWVTQNVAITLNSGTGNTIQLKSNGGDLGNIDEITVQ